MKTEYDFPSDEAYRKYLRMYFAGLAMQGLIANNQMVSAIITASKKDERAATIAECSIEIADELLKQLANSI